jgi:transcriptional regulator with XRE-family HTH domain
MGMPIRTRPDRQTLSRLRPGALIREARKLAGLSQAELARRVGTTQAVISRWERGLESPRVETLGRVLQACGFEADLSFRRHDDVDRAQIRGAITQTPEDRLTTVERVTDLLGLARRAG